MLHLTPKANGMKRWLLNWTGHTGSSSRAPSTVTNREARPGDVGRRVVRNDGNSFRIGPVRRSRPILSARQLRDRKNEDDDANATVGRLLGGTHPWNVERAEEGLGFSFRWEDTQRVGEGRQAR